MSDDSKKTREPSLDDPDAPASAEEIAASKRLREALEDPSVPGATDEHDLVRSLRAAWSPDALDEEDHASLLRDMPASAEEIRLASELRDALERGGDDHELVAALRAAHRPADLPANEHETILAKALQTALSRQEARVVALRPRRLAVVTVTTVVALAASVVLWITTNAARVDAPLAKARSTQPLFDEPFKAGESSARIDRIAMARATDYRDNRFAKWGVR